VGMSYQSPIEIFQSEIQNQIEGEIYKAVMRVGVNVDKDELVKALQYDRGQYQKGYDDRDSEIIKCKYCRHHRITNKTSFCIKNDGKWDNDDFCSKGERK
jgi:hypothetical protein